MSLKINTTLYLQRELVRFWQTENGADYAMGVAEVAAHSNPPHLLPTLWNVDTPDKVALAATLARRTQIASTYWTKNEMVDLTLAASAGRPGSAVHQFDMPHQHGFALFEDPMLIDMSGRKVFELERIAGAFAEDGEDTPADYVPTNACVNLAGFMWNQSSCNGKAGIDVMLFSSPDDKRDGLVALTFQERLRGAFTRTPPLLVMGTFFIPYGEDFEDDDVWHAVVATWWHLITQPISATNVQQANPGMTKKARKLDMKPNITVVTLRPRKHNPAAEGGSRVVDWSHRWLVGAETGGFWRQQWYPSLGIHKPVLISPYEKGPLDKPLIIKRKKIYAWRR